MARTKQFNRDEVLDKAKTLFWQKGYHATSVQDLVNHLGINRGSIYDTFGDKQQLYNLALASYQEDQAQFLSKHFEQASSIKMALQTLFENAYQTLKDKKGCFIVNCTNEYYNQHPDIGLFLTNNQRFFTKLVGKYIKQGQDNGEISEEYSAKELSNFVFTFFSGLQTVAKLDIKKKELKEIIDIGLSKLNH
ncbi:MAG: TetR/AcrR family transcriptional regulator [Bacteroidota bacterium]